MKTSAKKKPARPAASTVSTIADWTILIYLAGDNDLDGFGGKDLTEMKKVGSSDKLHVIVQRDTATRGAQACRYRVRRGTRLESDVVEKLGRINTGDPKVLEAFLNWGLAKYPARRTMAVLWNHGSGWDDTDIYEEARRRKLNPAPKLPASAIAGARRIGAPRNGPGTLLPTGFVARSNRRKRTRGPFFLTAFQVATVGGQRRAICFDDDAQDFLDSVEMKKVFAAVAKKAGRPFDVIGMDACLMAMVETGLQVQRAGKVFCASQEVEPGNGWPYDRILAPLAARPEMDGQEFSALIAREFVASYRKSETVTQSACDLPTLTAVVKAANELGAQLAKAWAAPEDPALKRAVASARFDSQGYEHPDYVDLWDFTVRLAEAHPPCAAATKAVQDALARCVFANHATHERVKNSHGLSIYLPADKQLSPLYKNLDFGKGGWASFLTARASR